MFYLSRRSPINREQIALTALYVLDCEGQYALSMRTVAKYLNVKAMSLYNHVLSKEDLLYGIVEAILNEVQYPAHSIDWKDALRQTACSFHDILLRHPNAIPIVATHSPITENGMKHVSRLLEMVKKADCSAISAFSLIHILLAYVIGHASMCASELRIVASDDSNVSNAVPSQAAVREQAAASQDFPVRDVRFEFCYGLDLLLGNL